MTGNRISQAYVELTTKGEGRVRRTLGALKGDMKTLDAQTKTTESRLEKLGKGADGLQGALGKLLMPIAFIGAVAGVASQFTRMLADAQAFRREMDQLSRASGQLDAALGERSRGRQFGTPEDIAALKATNDQLDQLRAKGAALAEQAESDIFSTVLGEVGNFFADDAVLTAAEKIDAIDAKANELATAAKAREGERAAAEQAERERRAALTRLETDSLRATELKARAAAENNDAARAELEIEAASIEHGIRRIRLADEINQLRRAGYDEEADAKDVIHHNRVRMYSITLARVRTYSITVARLAMPGVAATVFAPRH